MPQRDDIFENWSAGRVVHRLQASLDAKMPSAKQVIRIASNSMPSWQKCGVSNLTRLVNQSTCPSKTKYIMPLPPSKTETPPHKLCSGVLLQKNQRHLRHLRFSCVVLYTYPVSLVIPYWVRISCLKLLASESACRSNYPVAAVGIPNFRHEHH